MVVCFTLISNIAVTKCVSVNSVRAGLFLKEIFIMEQRIQFAWWLENNFKINLRDFIKNTESKLNFNDTELNWELLNYEIRKFIISYSKAITKEERARRLKLENTLKFLENNLTDNLKKQQYELLKCELDEIYDKIAKV